MAGKSDKKRQAKNARNKARSKLRKKNQHSPSASERTLIQIALRNPLQTCMEAGDLETGMVSIIATRAAGLSTLMAGFVVDLKCLGIKDCFIKLFSKAETNLKMSNYQMQGCHEKTPEYAKKLLQQAVDYARSIGFEPHRDYKYAALMFEEFDSSTCEDEFEFGMDGKPYYMQGPHDTPNRVAAIIKTLEKNHGENFYLTLTKELNADCI